MNASRAGRLGRVQLYDVSRSKIVRSLSSDELNQAAAQGSIGWFRNAKNKLCACMQPIPMQSRTSHALSSKVPLVQTDMELNAEGLCDGTRKFGFNRFGAVDDEIVGNRIDQSMSKVEAWPLTFDEKNVTVCAGQVHGVLEISQEQLAAL